jgi:hypothetical protein
MYLCSMGNSMETKLKSKFRPDPTVKLTDQARQVLRYQHYTYRTEQTYCNWILRYIKFHGGGTHPAKTGKTEIDAFLSHLATHGKVSASTRRQALNAIVFLYRHVLDQPIEEQLEAVKAKKRSRPPVVMTQAEVHRVMSHMDGDSWSVCVFGFRTLILSAILSMSGPHRGARTAHNALSQIDPGGVIIEHLKPIQTRFSAILEDRTCLKTLLDRGAESVRKMAVKMLQKVKGRMGFS